MVLQRKPFVSSGRIISTYGIPVKSHGIGNEITVSHISHAFQLQQNLRNKYYGVMNKWVKPLVCVLVVSDLFVSHMNNNTK